MESEYCCNRFTKPTSLGKILNTIQQGNATLIAPSIEKIDSSAKASALRDKLGANLLTQIPEIAQWLVQFPQKLDLAAIAYLDGENMSVFLWQWTVLCNM